MLLLLNYNPHLQSVQYIHITLPTTPLTSSFTRTNIHTTNQTLYSSSQSKPVSTTVKPHVTFSWFFKQTIPKIQFQLPQIPSITVRTTPHINLSAVQAKATMNDPPTYLPNINYEAAHPPTLP